MSKVTAKKTKAGGNTLAKLAGNYLVKRPIVLSDGTIQTERWETGIIPLDILTGGGFPKGKGVAVGSEEGVGKTTLLLHAALNIMNKYGKKVVYMDVEGGVTYDLLGSIGIDTSNHLFDPEENPDGLFMLLNVQTIQAVSRVSKAALEDPDTALVIIDSDTQVTDETLLEQEDLGSSKNPVGESARMWSGALRKIGALVNQSQATFVVVHQARNDLSGFFVTMKPSGGKAAKHFATIEIWGTRKDFIGEGDVTKDKTGAKIKKAEAIGAVVNLTTLKNRLGRPYRAVEAHIYFGKGISNKWSYRTWLENFQLVDEVTGEVRPMLKTGAWPNLKLPSGEYKAQGNAGVWQMIDEHWDEIEEFVKNNGGFTTSVDSELEEIMDN